MGLFSDELKKGRSRRGSGDGGGNTTPPPVAGDGGGNTTPPPVNEWWRRKRRSPAGDGGGNTTPPPVTGDGGGNTTPPPMEGAGRSLRDISVQFISLVPAAANMRQFIAKNAGDGRVVLERVISICKSDDDLQMLYGIVYVPDELDSQGDMATAEEIQNAAYRFMKMGSTNAVDAFHDGLAGGAFVGESWILKGGDPIFPDEPIGSWAVGIVVDDPELWKLVQDGTLTGLSMMGSAVADVVPVAKGLFSENLLSNMGYEITGALRDAVRAAMTSADVPDRMAALDAVWAEFRAYIAGVYGGASTIPVAVVQSAVVKEVAPVAAVAPVAVEKSLMDELAERLAVLERETVGRRSAAPVEFEKNGRVRGLKLL